MAAQPPGTGNLSLYNIGTIENGMRREYETNARAFSSNATMQPSAELKRSLVYSSCLAYIDRS